MHGVSVHSALAIKRQRRKREAAAKRKHKRRVSTTSTLASYMERERDTSRRANAVMGTVTMLHIGAIFTLIGCLLLVAALLTKQTPQEIAELLGTGIICLVIGIFLIILNSIYGKREEEDLHNYVEARLAKSRSGHQIWDQPESDTMIGAMPSATSIPCGREGDALGCRTGKLTLKFRPPSKRPSTDHSPTCIQTKKWFQVSVVLPLIGGLGIFLSFTDIMENPWWLRGVGSGLLLIGICMWIIRGISGWRLTKSSNRRQSEAAPASGEAAARLYSMDMDGENDDER